MTLRFVLDGVDMGDVVVRLRDGINGLVSTADGSPGIAGVVIEDPSGTLDMEGFHSFVVNEDACSIPRLFTGYIANKGITRGAYRHGAGRIWDCDVVDLNGILHLNVLHEAADKRPAESFLQRIDYVLGGPLQGLVYDNGGVDRSTNDPFEEADFRGQYADDVLRSINGGFTIFYVDWDETAPTGQEVSLWYQQPTAIVRTSTLRISNVVADQNATTLFPFIDARLDRQPEDQYGSIYLSWTGGRTYTERATTIAQMGLTRGVAIDASRIGRQATANRISEALLDTHADEADTITVILKIPRAQVNLVRQGDRIECKFSHLPGLTTFDFRRVERREVNLAPDNEEFYYVTLVLSNKSFSTGTGAGPGGGGDPSEFPHSGQPISLVQYKIGPGTVILDDIPTPGHILLAWSAVRATSGTGAWDVTSFTEIAAITNAVRSGQMAYRVVQPGDGKSWAGPLQSASILMEWEAAGIDVFVTLSDQAAGPLLCGGTITPTAGVAAVIVGGASIGDGDLDIISVVPGAGVTELMDQVGSGGSPNGWLGYKVVDSTSGTYSITGTSTNTHDGDTRFGGVTVALVGTTAAAAAPSPAQWVFNETPTPAPGGGRKDFATTWPFADGSLKVRVDDIDQTAALVSSSGIVPISGDLSDPTGRGPQAYTVPATTATVASPYGSAQVIAAIAAAGAGGSVLFPHAGSPYNFAVATVPASQTWWLAQPTTFINGTVTVQDTSIYIRGGKIANIHLTRPTQQAAGFHLADCYVLSSSGYGIQIEGSHNNVLIERCRFAGQSLDPIHITYDVGGDGNMSNFIVRDCIMSTNNNHSMISGNDGGGTNDLISPKILNNDINAGARQAGDGFGIELWGCVNGEIAYNDLRGGGFLMSTVRSQGMWVHHNRGTLGASVAYAFYEAGGSDHTGAVIEYNVVTGDGSGAFIYHDAGSNSCTFRLNNVTNVGYFVQGNGTGGGYTVTDNYYAGVGVFIEPNSAWGTPNTVARNGAGYGPVAGGTFRLSFDPRSDEAVTVDYQGR